MQTSTNRPSKYFCASPWIEGVLYADGSLSPCCLSNNTLGDWQKDTLASAWHSPQYQDFRRKIIEGEFPVDNCRRCYSNRAPRSLASGLNGIFNIFCQQLINFYKNENENLAAILKLQPFFGKLPQDITETERKIVLNDYKTALNNLGQNGELPNGIRLTLQKMHVIAMVTQSFWEGNLVPPIIAPYRAVQMIQKCNARCIQCLGTFQKKTLTNLTMADEHIPEALSHPEHIVNFFNNGTEFLFYKDWQKITSIISETGSGLTIFTNTILLTKPTIRHLIDNNTITYFNISLDGATKETVEIVRKNVIFDRMVENVTFLLQYAEQKKVSFPICFSFTLMKINHHELPEFVRLVERLKGDAQHIVCNINIQPLNLTDLQGYRQFVHEQHPSLLERGPLVALFQETLIESKRTGIPVYYTMPLKDFIQKGCPIPEFHDPLLLLEFGSQVGHEIEVKLMKGWHEVELEPVPHRWSDGTAAIAITSQKKQKMEIYLSIESFRKPRRCNFLVNGEQLLEEMITLDPKVLTIPITLKAGENIFELLSMDGAESPVSIKELNSFDSRQLAFHLRSFDVR